MVSESSGPTHSKVDGGNSMKGFLLLGAFLALDGLTSTFQEKLFKDIQSRVKLVWLSMRVILGDCRCNLVLQYLIL